MHIHITKIKEHGAQRTRITMSVRQEDYQCHYKEDHLVIDCVPGSWAIEDSAQNSYSSHNKRIGYKFSSVWEK